MSNFDNRKKPPPRVSAPSLMGDASLPGAFSQGGRPRGIEMTESSSGRRMMKEDSKYNSHMDVSSRPGSVAVLGMNGSSKSMMNESSKTVNTHTSCSTESSVQDNVTMVVPLPPPEEEGEEYLGGGGKRRTWTIIAAMAIAAVVMLAIIIPVLLVTGGNKNKHEHKAANTWYDDDVESEDEPIDPRLIIPSISNATVEAILSDRHSPEYQAYRWMNKDPYRQDYEPWRIEQRFAMAVVYYAWDGPGWGKNNYHGASYKWMSYYVPECDWMGSYFSDKPYCNDDGQVVWLNVHHITRIPRPIPAEAAFLSNLQSLDLSASHINGDMTTFWSLLVPSEEDNLSTVFPQLTTLRFSDSELSGTIPTHVFPSTLETLDLSHNKLTGTVPRQLGRLSQLEVLDLSKNALTGSLPEELGTMASLISFQVGDNPNLEPSLPSGFCSNGGEGSLLLAALVTDWCLSVEECCSN